MNAEHSETALEDPRERHQISNHSLPSQFRNLAVDDPEITRRIQEFYRDLTTLENTLCNVCLEQFPSIKANETGGWGRDYVISSLLFFVSQCYFTRRSWCGMQ